MNKNKTFSTLEKSTIFEYNCLNLFDTLKFMNKRKKLKMLHCFSAPFLCFFGNTLSFFHRVRNDDVLFVSVLDNSIHNSFF